MPRQIRGADEPRKIPQQVQEQLPYLAADGDEPEEEELVSQLNDASAISITFDGSLVFPSPRLAVHLRC